MENYHHIWIPLGAFGSNMTPEMKFVKFSYSMALFVEVIQNISVIPRHSKQISD